MHDGARPNYRYGVGGRAIAFEISERRMAIPKARFGPISPSRNAGVDMTGDGDPEGSPTSDPAGLAARKRRFLSKSDCPGSAAVPAAFGIAPASSHRKDGDSAR